MKWKKTVKFTWLCGTAHFFRYSFEDSFRKLFRKVDHVIFEGPLDDNFMAEVDKNGKSLEPDFIPLIKQLTETEIRKLERVVRGPEGRVVRFLGLEASKKSRCARNSVNHASLVCFFQPLDRVS